MESGTWISWGAAWLPGALPPKDEGEQSGQFWGSVMFLQKFLSLFPHALLPDLAGSPSCVLCVCVVEELVSEN